MNYGVEVYIDRDRVRLPEGLLGPLSAPQGAPLYGLYYPPPAKGRPFEERDYSQTKIKHDLMLTTVPYDLWPACAAGRIDIRHKRGALEKVLEVIKRSGLNILHLQCTRSGHRYATVNFVASLLGVIKPKANQLPRDIDCQEALECRNDMKNFYSKMRKKNSEEADFANYSRAFKIECDRLQMVFTKCLGNQKLVGELVHRRGEQASRSTANQALEVGRDILHFDDAFSRFPVGVWALKELSYFDLISWHAKTKAKVIKFRAVVDDDWSVRLHDPEYLHTFTGLRSDYELPTVGFANLDTEAYLIRVAILGQEHLKAFRSVSIDFFFKASPDRVFSIGLLHDLVQSIVSKWNIWRVHNYGLRYEPKADDRPGFTRGRISFIMEHDPDDPTTVLTNLPSNRDIERAIESIQSKVGYSELTMTAHVRPFTSRKVFISIKSADKLERAPEILDICREVGSEFGFLKSNVRTFDESAIDSVSREVALVLRESSGLIEFLMSDTDGESFTWVESEFFHATERKVPTVRIVDPRFKEQQRFFLDKPAIVLPQYASRKRFKEVIRDAFAEIVSKISDTGFPSSPKKEE